MIDLVQITLKGLFKPIVDYINPFFTAIAPQMEVQIVFLLSFFIAYILKYKNNWKNWQFGIAGIVIFGFFRYAGFGL